jgi:hypothetical protein
MVGFVAVLATAYLVLRPRSRRRIEAEHYHFRCIRCKQRIRFLSTQVGKAGQCRRCKQRFVFPDTKTAGVSPAHERT